MIDVVERLNTFSGIDEFQRVDNTHPLDLYIGYDSFSRATFLYISSSEPNLIESSEIIEVRVAIRNDKKWALSFSVTDKKFEELFTHFVKDLIESSKKTNSINGTSFIVRRYNKWLTMMRKTNGNLLSVYQIRGLIGELFVLKNVLAVVYGFEATLKAWIGSENTHQDFVFDDFWVEVKTKTKSGNKVSISSIEQLDTINSGELIVVSLDKTSELDYESISLNHFIEEVEGLLSDDLKLLFNVQLINRGYFYSKEYNKYRFRQSEIDSFVVTIDFPCLRRENIPNSIINANYDMLLSTIKDYKKK